MATAGGMDAMNMNNTDARMVPSSNEPGITNVPLTGAVGRAITISPNENLSRRSSVESTTTHKKRTKVSRACDQCRRKKLKCEYQGGSQSCVGCLKNKDKCAFDRVPLKRGPSKGYSRTRSISQERHTARKRSSGDEGNSTPIAAATTGIDQQDNFNGKNSPSVPLPPLHYYLPGSNGQKGQPSGSTLTQQGNSHPSLQQYPSIQQQFWKVPYYEHQFQRRSSLESINSDISVRQAINEPGIPSTASSVSRGQSRPAQGYASNRDPLADLLNDPPQSSSILPPLVRSSSVPHVGNNLPLPQYPYSQFSAAVNGSSSHAGQPPPLVGESLDKPSLPYSQQHQGSVFRRTNSVPEGTFSSSPTPRQSSALPSFPTGVVTSARDLKKDLVQARITNGWKTTERNNDYNCETDINMSSPSSNVECGLLSDMELIEQYYEHIHLNYPVLPVNKETLTNEILLVNTQPVSEVHKLNGYILTWFRTSLELLVRISSGRTGTRENSISLNGPSESSSNGGSCRRSLDLSSSEGKKREDPLFTQSVFVTTLNECFQKVVDIHPRVRENKDLISPKVTTIYLTTFIILNYILALVGYDNSFILGMSVTIFNEFKLFRSFLLRDVRMRSEFEANKEADSDNTAHEKKDGEQETEIFDMLYNRLYYSLIVFDSLQSCCFGVPKLISIPVDHMISPLFQPRGTLKEDKWSIEGDSQRFHIIMANLKLGALLTELCQTKKITHAFFPITLPNCSPEQPEVAPHQENYHFQKIRGFRIPNLDDDSTVAGLFFQFLWIERTLLDQLLSANDFRTSQTSSKIQQSVTIGGNEHARNGCLSKSFCVMISKSICSLTAKAHHLLQLMATLNPTNCIRPHSSLEESSDSDIPAKGSISPFAIGIFCHLFSVIEIAKNIPTSLIGYVMSLEAQDAHGQELVVALSKCMSDMIQIQRFSHSLKPFKIFKHGLHEDRKEAASSLEQLKRSCNYQLDQNESQDAALQQFIDIAWDLLEEELGWL